MCQKQYAAVTAEKNSPGEADFAAGGTGESLSMCFILVLRVNKHWDLIKAEAFISGCVSPLFPLFSEVPCWFWRVALHCSTLPSLLP